MRNFSHLQRKSRPWIAMIAAYAVALQMLLTAAVAGQMAAASSDAFPICYGTSIDGTEPGQSGSVHLHQNSCVQCCAGCSVSLADAVASGQIAYFGKGAVLASHPRGPCLVPAQPTPRLSQGPPLTV